MIDEHYEDDELLPSRSQLKREDEARKALGRRLTELKADQLAKLELPDDLREGIATFHRIRSREAQRRQIQYLGKVLRHMDTEALAQQMDLFDASTQAHAQHFQKLEQWRDRLLDNEQGQEALTQYLSQYPQADSQTLRNLVRSARKERDQQKAPASARKLFRYLREIDGL